MQSEPTKLESRTLYEKVGRRYVPVAEYSREACSHFREGSHLVVCRPGSTLTLYRVNPDHAGVIAALRQHEVAIGEAIRKAMRHKPRTEPLTPAQVKAWRVVSDTMGGVVSSAPQDVLKVIEEEVWRVAASGKVGQP